MIIVLIIADDKRLFVLTRRKENRGGCTLLRPPGPKKRITLGMSLFRCAKQTRVNGAKNARPHFLSLPLAIVSELSTCSLRVHDFLWYLFRLTAINDGTSVLQLYNQNI